MKVQLEGILPETPHRQSHAEQRYRSLVDRAPDAIVIVDRDSGLFVEEANPSAEKLYGLSRQELLGKVGPADLSPEFQPCGRRSAEAVISYVDQALAGEFPTFEWLHRTPAKGDIPCQISLCRFPHPTRNWVRGSVLDLTETRRVEAAKLDLERRLAQAQRLEAIGQLTGGIAHDFNNLLSVITGNLDLLSASYATSAEARELIRAAVSAAGKGAELTRSMLNFARRAPLQPELVWLGEVVHDMRELIGRTMPASIAVKTQIHNESWPVYVDAAGIHSALLNLVLNARDAIQQGGELLIELDSVELGQVQSDNDLKPGNYMRLSVADTGTGISPDVIDSIFDPYFTTKPPARNSGLGLSMVHGFITQSGGAVCVASTPDEGTTFDVYIPAADGVAPVAEASVPSARARILMVEDQPGVLKVLKRMVEADGHEVLTAVNGAAALLVFEHAGDIDLLITDVVMPGALQGFELARRLRQNRRDLPVIFMSGYSHDHHPEGSGVESDDTLLMKPISRVVLQTAVREALGLRRLQSASAS